MMEYVFQAEEDLDAIILSNQNSSIPTDFSLDLMSFALRCYVFILNNSGDIFRTHLPLKEFVWLWPAKHSSHNLCDFSILGLHFVRKSEACSVIAGVEVWASGGSTLDLGLHRDIIVPSHGFFPSPSAAPNVTQLRHRAFVNAWFASATISRHVQILCSELFSCCSLLSSISFETHSELTRIESSVFFRCSLKSVTIPRHVQILCSSCFQTRQWFLSISVKQILN
jgi:hypothetical protein